MGLMGLIRASYGRLGDTISGLAKSTDHPSISPLDLMAVVWGTNHL